MPPDYADKRTLPRDNRDVPRAARLEPSRRHPEGLARCQRIIRRPGERAKQCMRAARISFPVCGKHGAGYLAREQSGTRLSVRSNLRDGSRARPDTLQAVWDEQPRLRTLLKHFVEEEIDRESLYRHLLAMARTLASYHLERADLDDLRQLERAMAMHFKAADILMKLVTLENRYGPVNPREVESFISGAAMTLHTYVPKELRSEAMHFFRERLTPNNPNAGTRRRE